MRGVYEEYIDSKLEDSEIEKIKNIVDVLDFPISSEEDTSLGFVIGSIISQIDSQFIKNYNNLQKKNEIEDCLGILRRRASEIKSRFSSLGNSHVESLETVVETKERLPEKTETERLPEKTETEQYSDIPRRRASEIISKFRSWVNRHVEWLETAVVHLKTEEITTENETPALYRKTPEEFDIKPKKKVKFRSSPVIRNKPVRKIRGTSTKTRKPRARILRLSPSLEEV